MEKIYFLCTREINYKEEGKNMGFFTDLEAMKPYIIKAAEELWQPLVEVGLEPHCELDGFPSIKEKKCVHNCDECSEYWSRERIRENYEGEREYLLNPSDNVFVYELPLNGEMNGKAVYYQLRPLEEGVKLISELYGEEVYTYKLPEHLQDI